MPEDIDVNELREMISYDHESGFLYWNPRTACEANRNDRANSWNAKYAGKEALGYINDIGYKKGKIFNKTYKSHRVAWAIFYGEWPHGCIDHINGNRSDNRIVNLRVVTVAENNRNQKRHATNTSGVTGVRWKSRDKRWTAQITAYGDVIYLGYFKEKEAAIRARKEAEIKYGFHRNHGETR